MAETNQPLNILVVVAHPDDESLWFYEGLKILSKEHEVQILCLTYQADSPRGLELQQAIKDLDIKLSFAEIEDTGISNFLPQLASKLDKTLDSSGGSSHFDLVITHPFHGGEKPHPHHIQAFYTLAGQCKKRGLSFGFFCEKDLNHEKTNLLFSKAWWLSNMTPYLWKMYRTLWKQKKLSHEFYFNLKNFFLLISSSNSTMEKLSFNVKGDDKLRALSRHQSQLRFLQAYQAFNSQKEFLYLPQSIHGKLLNENFTTHLINSSEAS